MPASIGVNLRVTGHCRQGGRKYMEDFFSVAYQQTEDEKDLEYAFFGIYDGHGGGEAATFAKEHLMESIVRQKNFWSDKDEDVLKAIKEGYIGTHYAMWKEQENWPKTASGLPSTAGTTASVAFIRRGKIYIGHVGDSGIILGYQEPGNLLWKARPLTKDHKPENASEMSRIESCGGKVVTKSGVPRVVWNRPRIGHKGPVRRSTPIDEIPFLAVARSLGDLWSYNSALDEFVVSPDPDTCCIPIDSDSFRCLIFGTDGLWNMISPATAVNIVQVAEQHNEKTVLAGNEPEPVSDPSLQTAAGRATKVWINPSKCLVERALERWSSTRMRADNTSVITLMLDPPGPPRAEVIKNQRIMQERVRQNQLNNQGGSGLGLSVNSEDVSPPHYPENGLEIVTMYEEDPGLIASSSNESKPELKQNNTQSEMSEQQQMQELQMNTNMGPCLPPDIPKLSKPKPDENLSKKDRKYTEEYLNKVHREVLNAQEEVTSAEDAAQTKENRPKVPEVKETKNEPQLQSNEVSSSCNVDKLSPVEESPPCARCTRSHDIKRPQKGASPTKPNKNIRSSSESPKRKTRPLRAAATRRTIGTAKREHSDPDLSRGEVLDSSRLAPGPSNTPGVEPPQKLRRSRSLGPRDFTLRSSGDLKNLGRSLRDRDRAPAASSRHSLLNSFRKLSTNQNRSFTPVRQAIQTRNRLKRLNNK